MGSDQSKYHSCRDQSRRLWLIMLVAVGLVLETLAAISSPVQRNASAESSRKLAAENDSYCGTESCPGQVLFKLSKCPRNLDTKQLGNQLSAFFASSTGLEDEITVESVANDCIFVAKSSNKNVKELIRIFQIIFSNQLQFQTMLNRNDSSGIVLQDFEPNFKMHLDVETSTKGTTTERSGSLQEGDFWWFGKAEPGTDAVTAWERFGDGSKDVIVGVLDTGISQDNTAVAVNTWHARKPFSVMIGRRKVTCGTGALGFDAADDTSSTPCAPVDQKGHGTHVAGIISSSAKPRVGVTRNVQLMALKVADAHGDTCVSNVLKAIDFAIQAQKALGIRLKVLNNSYYVATPCSDQLDMLRDHILEANKSKMLFVASAGQTDKNYPQFGNNDDYPVYPANFYCLPNVISVTAISQSGTFSESVGGEIANYGRQSVSLGAPGSGIWSTWLPGSSMYAAKTGTSMAAPFVSGAAALLLSVQGCSDLPPKLVREKIFEGTVRTTALVGMTATNGRLNIFDAISKCARPPFTGKRTRHSAKRR